MALMMTSNGVYLSMDYRFTVEPATKDGKDGYYAQDHHSDRDQGFFGTFEEAQTWLAGRTED